LAGLLAEAVESFAPAAAAAGLSLRLEAPEPLVVQGDASRLHQVLANLLSNAVKFTPKGGSVRIAARPDGGFVRVEVTDSGTGFLPGQVELLFQPFSQLHDGSSASARGTGLGLYIVRGIVERHGGSIGASSAGPGRGATFWFTLPLASRAR
jgi:signal transduction histidine kinase